MIGMSTTEVLFREPGVPFRNEKEAAVPFSKDTKTARPAGSQDPPFPAWIKAEYVLVTPELAAHYRDKEVMHANRTQSKLDTSVLAAMMAEGNFYPDISVVYFDAEDRPYDGNHRFGAVIESGLSQWMLFIRGVREEATPYIDTNRKRTYGDNLKIQGVSDYSRVSVVARMMALYAKFGIEGVRSPSGRPVTAAEKDVWLGAPGLMEAIRKAENLARAVRANASLAAYTILQTARYDPDGTVTIDPDGFWESVRTGAGLEERDPALTLRNQLLKSAPHQSYTAKVDPRLMELYLHGTAWNKHVRREKWTRPNPVFDVRPGGTKVFPSSQVPELLPFRRPALTGLQQAYARVGVKGK
jgi:hypothetical protein